MVTQRFDKSTTGTSRSEGSLISNNSDGLKPKVVANRLVEVAFARFAFAALIAVPDAVAKPNQFVDVPLAKVKLVILPLPEVKLPNNADVDETVVAIKFVVVTVPKLPFQRSADEPSESVASTFGLRLV